MTDIGPNQYQGGVSQGTAPQLNRYDRQVDIQGAFQPDDARGQQIISGFGKAAPDLAKGMDQFGAAALLWIEQQKSAAQLYGRQILAHTAASAQPGQSINHIAGARLKQFTDGQLKSANTPELRGALSSELAHVTDQIQTAGQQLDYRQAQADVPGYFDRTLLNKEQLYDTLPYDDIDAHLADDLGGINSLLSRLPIDKSAKATMQQEMLLRLTNAANIVKIRRDPERYLQSDALDQPVQSSINGLSYIMGTNDQRVQWRAEAQKSIDARYAAAAQAAQQQAAEELQLRRNTTNNLIEKSSAGALVPADILSSGLSSEAQHQAIAMMARGSGAGGNDALHRQLFEQALNGVINDKSELLPNLASADGISHAQAQNVAAAARLAHEPFVRRFVADALNPIVGHRFNRLADPHGDRQFSNMLFDLTSQIREANNKGLSPRDILDPSSKYYVGDRLLAAHARNEAEVAASVADEVRQLISSGVMDTIRSGEDPIAFMNSRGLEE